MKFNLIYIISMDQRDDIWNNTSWIDSYYKKRKNWEFMKFQIYLNYHLSKQQNSNLPLPEHKFLSYFLQ